jgi:fluoroacetyl-CoA thioesterase
MVQSFDDATVAALVGIEGTATLEVTPASTAIALGSGDLPVLGTPRLIALMEEAACAALADVLLPESTTVGIHVDVRHSVASPLGASVTATAQVTDIDGTRILFDVTATHRRGDETVEIGRGTHRRVVVDRAAFLARVDGS